MASQIALNAMVGVEEHRAGTMTKEGHGGLSPRMSTQGTKISSSDDDMMILIPEYGKDASTRSWHTWAKHDVDET